MEEKTCPKCKGAGDVPAQYGSGPDAFESTAPCPVCDGTGVAARSRAEALIARGYCRTSNRYRIVSRIDRPDWVAVLAEALNRAPADFYSPREKAPDGRWCDHYRRVHSKDKILELPPDVFALMPTSDFNPIGYTGPDVIEHTRGMVLLPIDMVLHCPKCHMQHIDSAETKIVREFDGGRHVEVWDNPPHRSHLCSGCGCVWRPADVCTNGVAAVTTKGRNDTWPT